MIAWFAPDIASLLWLTANTPVMSTPVMTVMTSTSYGGGSHNGSVTAGRLQSDTL